MKIKQFHIIHEEITMYSHVIPQLGANSISKCLGSRNSDLAHIMDECSRLVGNMERENVFCMDRVMNGGMYFRRGYELICEYAKEAHVDVKSADTGDKDS